MIRKTISKIKEILQKALLGGVSARNLALSASVGVYIAFSPFPGLHTLMMLAATWLFRLHFPTLFIFSSINNPWTMIPFFSLDYFFGHWLVHSCMGWEPSWVISLAKVFGEGSICLWSFLIGGNVLGIIAGVLSYPPLLLFFKQVHNHITAVRGDK